MNWSDEKLKELKVGPSDVQTQKVSNRQYYLNQTDNHCQFCGGKYFKYLMCSVYENEPHVFCRACFVLIHLNNGFHKEYCVAVSELTQKEIVRKTVDFIIKNDLIPFPHEIDHHARLVHLSSFEISNLIMYYGGIPEQLERFKIFFTQDFDTKFIYMNDLIKGSLFIDEVEEKDNVEIDTPPQATLTKQEESYLRKFFSPNFVDSEIRKERLLEEADHRRSLKREQNLINVLKELGVNLEK